MKTYLLFIFFLCLGFPSNSQDKSGYNYFVQDIKTPDNSTQIEINTKGDTVLVAYYKINNLISRSNQEFTKVYKGTPFFRNGWYKGVMRTDNGASLNFTMAYNIQKDEVYLVNDPTQEAKSIKPTEFEMEGHTFKQFKDRYYEFIYEGKSLIMKEYQCILQLNSSAQKTGYEPEGGASEYEGEFLKSAKYYLKNENKLKEIPLNKRVFKLFGEHSKTVEAYAKSNELRPNKEGGLLAIFKYFDSL
jgi:hypothetical protein